MHFDSFPLAGIAVGLETSMSRGFENVRDCWLNVNTSFGLSHN